MRILITGGTGLIGRSLTAQWLHQRHDITILSRTPERVAQICPGAKGTADLNSLHKSTPGFDAVVNLAGAPIADRPWTQKRRSILWKSRISLTEKIVSFMGQQDHKPALLLSSSAVGWYGDQRDDLITESSPARDTDFGSTLCQAWENAALRAQDFNTRVAIVRTAPVLSAHGGMLQRMCPAFRLGLGGRIGSGHQWMPWIHLQDIVQIYDTLLHNNACHGPYNAVAPQLIRNTEFTQALANTLHRPAKFVIPAALLKLALGEMSSMMLNSQRIQPEKLEQIGYNWAYPDIESAMRECLGKH
ncbi:NAD-dependent epimerase/dehydratase [Neokomagataea thailandica NBRC 106555]|uniref:TIGR01777 family protein n=2 Tax=Neokomagataea TaxID=1223423 RepID=A0A4Y6V6L7_9PROT|nr:MULTISPECIES: TIGR01777 family oxidoreductase [Neokomagataea]QDH24290.1 TIGR01777 family protein [Neokomagataea tanensis]GBR53044.1 NAD-dependent epimerase/dehydratase [Neokomagataea thailandica NBRC 106555]